MNGGEGNPIEVAMMMIMAVVIFDDEGSSDF